MHFQYWIECVHYVYSQTLGLWLNPIEINTPYSGEFLPRHAADWHVAVGLYADYLFQTYQETLTQDMRASLLAACIKHYSMLNKFGGKFIAYHDERYPALLRHIPDPPLGLNILGSSALLTSPHKTAIVGARKAYPGALEQSVKLGRYFAERKHCVVSGGAFGCDIAAHHGVLSACIEPTPAIVVFAGGLLGLYPRGNSHFFDQLISTGACFVSERLWYYPARARDFPIRNRIIAGMVQKVVLVQAAERSGAMLTANRALHFGREVYVSASFLPAEQFRGNERLLWEGAFGFDGVQNFEENRFLVYGLVEGQASFG